MLDIAVKRLESFGYKIKSEDKGLLDFAVEKAVNTVKNECNVSKVPEGLVNIAVDMAVGEFLTAKKAFSAQDIAGLDLDYAVKQIQVGDVNTVFAVGDGSLTPEQRLDGFINYLLSYGRREFDCYRKIRW
ncbi:MAG: hypothetical protein HDT47_02575 [Ruminococcaceae bacterium]|nr:hypothetical protein [Oscillospiraceae bacterium]